MGTFVLVVPVLSDMGTFVLVVPVLSDMNIFVLSCAKDHVFVSLIKLLSFEVFKNTLQEFIIYMSSEKVTSHCYK